MSNPRLLRARVLPLVFLLFATPLFAAPPKLSSISVSPNPFAGGSSPVCTVTLSGAAPNKGAAVTVTSSNPGLVSSTTITVPGGQTSASASLATQTTTTNASVTLTGSYNATATTTVTVTPPSVCCAYFTPSQVTGGRASTTLTVALNGRAPVGGAVVSLSSDNSALPVPATITIPVGTSSASVTVYPTTVGMQTLAYVTATAYGTSATGQLLIDPCSDTQPGMPYPSPLDHVWIDEYPAPGSTVSGTGYWVGGPGVFSYYAFTTASASGAHDITFTNAQPRLIGTSENVIAYMRPTYCNPPREIVLGWHTTAGQWKKAYFGSQLIGGESGMLSLGAVPNIVNWSRLVIPASQLGVGGATVDGYTMQAYDGEVWGDRIGSLCPETLVTPPSIPSADTLWIDDSLPAGASMGSNGLFDTSQHASGTKALVSTVPLQPNYGDTIDIQTPGTTFPVFIGETLVVYALADGCEQPSEIMVTWQTTAGESKTALWGTPHGFPGETTSRGPVPTSSQWMRLEVPAADLGIEERNVNRIQLFSGGGTTWFDAIGKSGTACVPPTEPQPTIPAGDTVWVDDSVYNLGSGAYWDTTQSASGTQSMTMAYTGPTGEHSFVTGFSSAMPVYTNEGLVTYVLLDPCAPPSEIAFTWTDSSTNSVRGAYWGTGHGWWSESSGWTRIGDLPAAGSWARLTVPASTLSLGGHNIAWITSYYVGGKVWFDHYGKYGLPCVPATAAQPSMPSTDTVWFDEGAVSQLASYDFFDTSQAASGSGSYTPKVLSTQYNYTTFSNVGQAVGSGEKLVFYVLVNQCGTTTELLPRWWAGGAVHGCYFGSAGFGGEDTLFFYAGPLPQPGVWTRVEIPASALGLEGQTVTDFDVMNTGGQVWVDHIGKSQ
jgi:hypothetical protein